MTENYKIYEERLAASYADVAKRYRRDDSIEVETENHRRLCGNVGRICASFGRKIDVLDAGCGTGRYFHCLKDVNVLVGLDISAEMLREANDPVHPFAITAKEIRLVQGNIYEYTFPPESFDLIYSLGVFGHGAQFTLELCRRFREWLRPGGRLYFNALETSVDPAPVRMRKKIRRILYPALPRAFQRKLDQREARLPVFKMTHDELEALMREGGFSDFSISTNVCRSSLWTGVHLECTARK